MDEIEITQAEADSLIAVEKCFADDKEWTFPAAGQRVGLEGILAKLNASSEGKPNDIPG